MNGAGQRLAWHGLACTLPAGWEVTAYRLGEEDGEFRLHRRLDPVAQCGWKRLPGRPDAAQVMQERHRRWCEERAQPVSDLRISSQGPWTCGEAPGAPLRAVCWQPDRRRLVEWTFGLASPEERAALLASAALAEDDAGAEWSLFGLGVRPGGRWRPVEVEARPAAVRLVLESDPRRRLVVRRFGLARHLLAGRGLDDWYARLLRSSFARVESVEAAPFRGHDGVLARFRMRGEHALEKAMGRRWHGLGRLWYDRAAMRLHAVESIARRAEDLVEVDHAIP